MLEVPPEWNAVPDLKMEDNKGLMIMETNNMRKRVEVAQWCRKRQKKYDIHPEKWNTPSRILFQRLGCISTRRR